MPPPFAMPRYTWENESGGIWKLFDNQEFEWIPMHLDVPGAPEIFTDDTVPGYIGWPPGYVDVEWGFAPGGGLWDTALADAGDVGGGDFVIDNDGDGIDDREQGEENLRPGSNWNLGSAGPGPFALMAPWAAWNALPNMISELNRTMDYWLTKNQQQALARSKLWAMLKAMGMITGNQIDEDWTVTPMPGDGDYDGDGDGDGDGGGRRRGYGPGPSSIVNVRSSETSPTYAAYGDRIEAGTAPQSAMPLLSGRALANLTSGAGATDPLSEITSQGLGSSGLGAVSGVVEPAVSQAGAAQAFSQAKQLADQTVGLGTFAGGLGAQAGDLGKAAFETEMRKKLGLVGPFMQPFSQWVS